MTNEAFDAAEFIPALVDMIDRGILPLEREFEHVLKNPRQLYSVDGSYTDEALDVMTQARRVSAQAGFYGAFAAKELGGQGIGPAARFQTWETLFRRYGGGRILPYLAVPHWTSGPSNLLAQLQDVYREKLIGPVMAGEMILCFAMSEPDAGSDAWSMKTKAVRHAGGWTINGTKQWISHAGAACWAFVFAVTDDEARADRTGGITCFLVPTDAPGFKVDSTIRMFGALGGKETIVSLTDVNVTEAQVVGEVGRGFALALMGVSDGRMFNAGRAVGFAEWALDMAVEYAQTRTTFGHRIAEHQSVANLLADCAIDILAGKSMSIECATQLETGTTPVRDIAIVKAFTTEMAFRVLDRCMQVHGALGFTNEVGLYDAWHQIRAARVADGTGEIMRKSIASRLLKGDLNFCVGAQ